MPCLYVCVLLCLSVLSFYLLFYCHCVIPVIGVLVGQDHCSAGENVHTQDTAAVSTALLGTLRPDNRTRLDGH